MIKCHASQDSAMLLGIILVSKCPELYTRMYIVNHNVTSVRSF